MELTLDQVREELAGIHDELLALPSDAFARRSELRERRNELRQLSHRLADGKPLHDSATLKAAFTRLQEVRDRLLESHVGFVSTSVGDAGISGEFTTAINKAIDAGTGIDEIEKRIKEILTQLRDSD